MVTIAHQWLVLWLARKMTADGFTIRGYQGPTPQGGMWNRLRPPFEIRGYRPDLWGSSGVGEAFGEAKTVADIDTPHTRAQLLAFASYGGRRAGRAPLVYIAVPRSGVYELDHVLRATGLLRCGRLRRLHIPDCLLVETA